ncbi:MAG TPA: DUF4352 domain-containing protein [Candidatus Mediterraneibacter stercoripullorum]|nr:DUF4352 domain-containing protein [Candidatus Mediterraneibacter stercoripullorum]
MKRTLLVCLLVAAVSVFSGCSAANDAATAIQSQGREYGETFELNEGDTMSTAFFDMAVNSAEMVSEIDGYVPSSDTDTFLVVNITVKNTFIDDNHIPMSDTDFELGYNGADESSTIFPESEFATEQLPAEYQIEINNSLTGNLIYVVPGDADDFRIYYYDLWDDNFEGNAYWLPFSVN